MNLTGGIQCESSSPVLLRGADEIIGDILDIVEAGNPGKRDRKFFSEKSGSNSLGRSARDAHLAPNPVDGQRPKPHAWKAVFLPVEPGIPLVAELEDAVLGPWRMGRIVGNLAVVIFLGACHSRARCVDDTADPALLAPGRLENIECPRDIHLRPENGIRLAGRNLESGQVNDPGWPNLLYELLDKLTRADIAKPDVKRADLLFAKHLPKHPVIGLEVGQDKGCLFFQQPSRYPGAEKALASSNQVLESHQR